MNNELSKKKFIELRASGLTYDKIAKELGVTKRTLINWSKEFENEIANLKATELEKLHDEYYMMQEKKITLFGEKLKEIIKELDMRDLSEVSTEKLLLLMIKYSDYLSKEMIEPIFTKEVSTSEFISLEPPIKKWKG